MQFIHSSSLLLLLALLTACSSKSSSEELTKELQTVSSWTATAEMVGNAWVRGAVPTAYAKKTLSTAQQELQKETGTLVQLSTAPTQRSTLLKNLQLLEKTVGQMSTAVEQADHHKMTQEIQKLSMAAQKIKTFAQTQGMQL